MHARFALMVAALGCTGCSPLVTTMFTHMHGADVRGSGTIKDESREVGAFTRLQVENAFRVKVVVGPKESVKLRTDDNILPLIETVFADGTLSIRLRQDGSIRPSESMEAVVTTPRLEALRVSGACELSIGGEQGQFEGLGNVRIDGASSLSASGLQTEQLSLRLDGASRATLAGRVEEARIDVSGASRLDAGGLEVSNMRLEANGASHARVRASKSVAGSLSGAAQVELSGEAERVALNTSGAASFRRSK